MLEGSRVYGGEKGNVTQRENSVAAMAMEVQEQAQMAIGMPDRRAMNKMDPETKVIHVRLEVWARWAKANPELRAFPESTLLGKVVEFGIAGAAQGGAPVTMSDAVQITERAVNKLGEIDRKVIISYYMKWQPIESLARMCRMRTREFQNVLRRARFRVRCYVEAMEQAEK